MTRNEALTAVAAAAQDLAAALAAMADDPADRVRLLGDLAGLVITGAAGAGTVGQALARGRDAMASLCRRAALTQLARATAVYAPGNADEAEALRDAVCAALQAEEIAAADGGEAAVHAAFRKLRLAVARDLTARGADLSRLRTIATPAPLPALAAAQLAYGDGARADDLLAASAAPHPLFLPTSYRAPSA